MIRAIVKTGLLALGLSVGSTLCAQDSSAVAIGVRLRVRTAPGSPWHYGVFGGVAADSLVLITPLGAADHLYYGPSLDAIDVRDQNRDVRSAHIRNGAAAGALTGAVLLLVAVRHCTATSRSTDGPPCSIGYLGLPLWALGGLVAGGGVGAAWPVRHWARVTWAALAPDGRARP